MTKGKPRVTNLVDFTQIKNVKDYIETAADRIVDLENSLYAILDCHRLDVAKEMAADALGEDLAIYLEEDIGGVKELDFDNLPDGYDSPFHGDE